MKEAKWDMDVSILTNTIVMREVMYVFGVAFGAVVALVMGLIIHDHGLAGLFSLGMDSDLKYPLMLMSMWLGLTALFILVFWHNKYPLTYTLNSYGVLLESRREQVSKNQKVGCLLMLLGALMGQAGAVGIGLLATGNQDMQMPWKDVKKVRYYPKRRVIQLNGGYSVRMIIFCRPDNYAFVAKQIEENRI